MIADMPATPTPALTDATSAIARALAQPLTHRVTTHCASGKVRTHDTRSLASAENHAVGERRKIGRDLIDRMTGEAVRVVAVTVDAIEGRAS